MTKINPPLFPSQEKIRRAKSKFDYLKAIINAYAASNPYSVRGDVDGKIARLIARREKDPPRDIGFEIVEAVGHLRSALDKLAIALVELNGRGISGVGFPFGGISEGKPDPFPSNRMEDGIKKKLTDDQWRLIAHYRPYPGGNDTLWSINQVANADKHGAGLVEVIPRNDGGMGLFGPGTDFGGGTRIRVRPPQDDSLPYDYERETVIIEAEGGQGQFSVKHEPAAIIVFSEIAPVTGRNVLTTLNEQIRITDHIVKAFSSAFF
jgi:hypothetical protein